MFYDCAIKPVAMTGAENPPGELGWRAEAWGGTEWGIYYDNSVWSAGGDGR